VAYAVGGGGMSGGHASQVKIMWARTLDPKSPDFGYHDVGVVASSDGVENHDAIDPAFLMADGHLWLSYGTYFGSIRMIELDPATGQRMAGNQPVDVAIDMEATALMYRDGWYYLLGTHGTCCDGPNSSYNIRVGRSRSPTGPYVDNMGIPLLKGGGKLVVAGRGRVYGPGHFGLIDLGGGMEKFSMHYEADMDRSGRSVLGIQPLLWRNGWPVAGTNIPAGTYEIQSERSGGALELDVDFVRINFERQRGFFGPPTTPVGPIADLTLEQDRRPGRRGAGRRSGRLHDQTPPAMVGRAGRRGLYGRALLQDPDRGHHAGPGGDGRWQAGCRCCFSGTAGQLWRIDQLTDGSYRITPRLQPTSGGEVALVAAGAARPCSPGSTRPVMPGAGPSRHHSRGRSLACNR
jgi:arabinan endo-1,5-alpha-L-arabinosidase